MIVYSKRNQIDQKSFTLIELLIVVAIIGVVVTIALPQFSAYSARAYNAAARADLKNFKSAMEAAAADGGGYQDL